MKAKCKRCGDTEWLLQKSEKRFYYAVVKTDELRWVEQTKLKEISPYTLICSKCEGNAGEIADLGYTIKEKPLKVIWQTNWWLNNQNTKT